METRRTINIGCGLLIIIAITLWMLGGIADQLRSIAGSMEQVARSLGDIKTSR